MGRYITDWAELWWSWKNLQRQFRHYSALLPYNLPSFRHTSNLHGHTGNLVERRKHGKKPGFSVR